MGDYFAHWINIGKSAPDKSKLPKIFNVNWFRKDTNGKFLWPGYGDNIRVLKWIFERLEGSTDAIKTPIGYIPEKNTLDYSGLDNTSIKENELFLIDKDEWANECSLIDEQYANLKDSIPNELTAQLDALKSRLKINVTA
jgi:phosphoenolpyruvate carboxykinase (GTP)